MNEQLTLWDAPTVDRDGQPVTCPACGQVSPNDWLHSTDHGSMAATGECMSRVLRRNHVHAYVRAIAGNGAGRVSKRGLKWTPEEGWRQLTEGVARAREARIDETEIAQIILGELACGGGRVGRMFAEVAA